MDEMARKYDPMNKQQRDKHSTRHTTWTRFELYPQWSVAIRRDENPWLL